MRKRLGLSTLLTIVVAVAASCSSEESSMLYDASATRRCLVDRPEYVLNASAPSTKAQMLVRAVVRTKRDRAQGREFIPRGTSVVDVVFTPAHTVRQDLVSLSFFPTELSARHLYAVDAALRKGFPHPEQIQQQKRNVVAVWTPTGYSAVLRSILFGCLRTAG